MSISDAALLVIRIVLGVIFIVHGGQKLFAWYGGPGIQGFTQGMGRFGVAHPVPLGWMAALSEFGGGLLVLLGLLTPFAAALIISTMLVAIARVHFAKGFFNTKGGWEFNLSLITLALVLVLLGAGAISIDHLLGIAVPIDQYPYWAIIVLVVIAGGGLVSTEASRRMALRKQSPG